MKSQKLQLLFDRVLTLLSLYMLTNGKVYYGGYFPKPVIRCEILWHLQMLLPEVTSWNPDPNSRPLCFFSLWRLALSGGFFTQMNGYSVSKICRMFWFSRRAYCMESGIQWCCTCLCNQMDRDFMQVVNLPVSMQVINSGSPPLI